MEGVSGEKQGDWSASAEELEEGGRKGIGQEWRGQEENERKSWRREEENEERRQKRIAAEGKESVSPQQHSLAKEG